MFIPILAAGSLELAESLTQAGTVPVAGTKEDQDQQQQEAEEQACGQRAGGCGERVTQARGEQGQAVDEVLRDKGGSRGPRVKELEAKGQEEN